MRILGIDYGKKNIGLAISDELGKLAFPFSVIENDKNATLKIEKICLEKGVELIVIGESKDFNQNDNPIMNSIKLFAKELEKKLSIPFKFHPEFLTSKEAERLQGKNKMIDASAATIILKSYLDTNARTS